MATSKKIVEILSRFNDEEGRRSAEVILCFVLKMSRTQLFLSREQSISSTCVLKFERLMKRVQEGEPLAYVLKKVDFCGYEIFVNRSVLIPRQETEELVCMAVDCIKKLCKNLDFVDVVEIGVGSGCISLAVASELKKNGVTNYFIHGIELSRLALRVARKNLLSHQLEKFVAFDHGDLFKKFHGLCHVLIANLPYVQKGREFVQPSVYDYEPHLALFAGKDGFDLYRELFAEMKKLPALPFTTICEIGYNQKNVALSEVKKHFPQAVCHIFDDLNGLPRFMRVDTGSLHA